MQGCCRECSFTGISFNCYKYKVKQSFGLQRVSIFRQHWASTIWDLFSVMMGYQGMNSVGESGWQSGIFWSSKKSGSIFHYRGIGRFKPLKLSWNHKLMYSLSCLCLSSADRRRLDGFQNRCLRSIFGIPPAFISRFSSAQSLQTHCYRHAIETTTPPCR